MNRRKVQRLILLLFFCLALTGCSHAERPPKEVRDLYTQYMDALCMPAKEEAAEYCYFLNDTVRELFFEGGDTVESYKILS